ASTPPLSSFRKNIPYGTLLHGRKLLSSLAIVQSQSRRICDFKPSLLREAHIGRTVLTLLKSYLVESLSAVHSGHQTSTRVGLVTWPGTDDPQCCEGLTTAP